jgi:hypothetical protein
LIVMISSYLRSSRLSQLSAADFGTNNNA